MEQSEQGPFWLLQRCARGGNPVDSESSQTHLHTRLCSRQTAVLGGCGWRLAHPQPSCLQGILLGSLPYGQRNEGTEQVSRVSGNEHQKWCQPGSELTQQVPQMIVMVGQGFNEMVREGLLG